MNNDLISRNALKEKLSLVDILTIDDVFTVIDNTPTIPLPDYKEGYKQAILDGKTNYSRPHGEWQEWINEKWGGITIYCPYCKEDALEKSRYLVYRQVKSNFCPNCGADMREGDNE